MVSGRVTTASGKGIRNARVMMINQDGETRIALTGSFGYFRFKEVSAGETYMFSVKSKRFRFSSGTQLLFITDEFSDLIFTADW